MAKKKQTEVTPQEEKNETVKNNPFNKTKGIVKLDSLKKGDSFCFRLNRNEYYIYAGKQKGRFAFHHKNRPDKLYFENKNVFVVKEK